MATPARNPFLAVRLSQLKTDLTYYRNIKTRMSLDQADMLLLRNFLLFNVGDEDKGISLDIHTTLDGKPLVDDPNTIENEVEVAYEEYEERIEDTLNLDPGAVSLDNYSDIAGQLNVKLKDSMLRRMAWLDPFIDSIDRDIKFLTTLQEDEGRQL